MPMPLARCGYCRALRIDPENNTVSVKSQTFVPLANEPFVKQPPENRQFVNLQQKLSLSKVCGCCQRELQRRQIRQGGKRGRVSMLWGLCVTSVADDAERYSSDCILEHRTV